MFPPGSDPYTDGFPKTLIAFLYWRDDDPSHLVDTAASIRFRWNATTQRFEGKNHGPGYSLGGSVYQDAPGENWTCQLVLYWANQLDEDHEWMSIPLGPDVPWDSGRLILEVIPGQPHQQMQVWA